MRRLLMTAILVSVVCLVPSRAAAASMPPVQMTFVDAADGSAVAGAVVLFQANGREGTFTGHGGRTANLFAVEGVTDDAGAVRFPRQEFSTQPFFLNTNYENPSMVALKPGYALLVLVNARGVPHETRTVTTWEYNNQTVRMKRAPDSEIPNTVWSAAVYADQAMSSQDLCGWKKVPRFLVAIDRLATEWTRKRASFSDPAVRMRSASSPLQRLFMNDALFVEKGCGSPREFFAPYLR
jgi:hypothetical protein